MHGCAKHLTDASRGESVAREPLERDSNCAARVVRTGPKKAGVQR
jgi:hypothetical protein